MGCTVEARGVSEHNSLALEGKGCAKQAPLIAAPLIAALLIAAPLIAAPLIAALLIAALLIAAPLIAAPLIAALLIASLLIAAPLIGISQQCSVVWCGVVWCVVWCGAVRCSVVWCHLIIKVPIFNFTTIIHQTAGVHLVSQESRQATNTCHVILDLQLWQQPEESYLQTATRKNIHGGHTHFGHTAMGCKSR